MMLVCSLRRNEMCMRRSRISCDNGLEYQGALVCVTTCRSGTVQSHLELGSGTIYYGSGTIYYGSGTIYYGFDTMYMALVPYTIALVP